MVVPVPKNISVPSLRVGWLKTDEAAFVREEAWNFSTLSSGRLAETGLQAPAAGRRLADFQYPLFGSVG